MMADETITGEKNTPIEYPSGKNLSWEVISDIKNEVPDQEIIAKLESTSDLMMALWGELRDGLHTLRYVPLHHAASQDREMLLHFLLHHRPSPEYVNLVNDNFYTALRYAKRSRLLHIVEILQNAGAHEEFPD